MNLQEAINDLKTAADETFEKFGQAAGETIVKDAIAEGVSFVAAKIRQLKDEEDEY